MRRAPRVKVGRVIIGGMVFGAGSPSDFPRIPCGVVSWPGGTYMIVLGGLKRRELEVAASLIRNGKPTRRKVWFPPASVRQARFERRMAAAKGRRGR